MAPLCFAGTSIYISTKTPNGSTRSIISSSSSSTQSFQNIINFLNDFMDNGQNVTNNQHPLGSPRTVSITPANSKIPDNLPKIQYLIKNL